MAKPQPSPFNEPVDRRLEPPRRSHDDEKWPAWKVSTFVIAFCGAFWFLMYLLVRAMFF